MTRLPEDYINQIKNEFDCADKLLESFNDDYVRSLRINRRKNKKGLINDGDTIDKAVLRQDIVSWEEAGIYYKDAPGQEAFNQDNPNQESSDMTCNKESIGKNSISYKYSPGKSPLHAAGAYYIQEASAMLPVAELYKLEADSSKVLDLCAAPGGKSTQIADYMDGRGLLVSNEIVASRAKILSENIERMAVTNALVISEDPLKLKERFPAFFDRILVDAPCSGEGMFRKHNEAADEWSLDNVQICADRQDMILDCAVLMLAPDGVIAYSTCTFNRKEDEGSIERFLDRHPEFELIESRRIFPHIDRGEGHFSAILRRKKSDAEISISASLYDSNIITINSPANNSATDETAEIIYGRSADTGKANIDCFAVTNDKRFKEKKDKRNQRIRNKSRQGRNVNSKLSEAIDAFMEFAGENLEALTAMRLSKEDILKNNIPEDIKGRLILFGDRLFLTPEHMPDIEGLKVLRPGLHLGTIVKDRFEPSHALALSLSEKEVTYSVNYSEGSQEALSYLKGMTLNHEGSKGWYLIMVEGMSLGWGKLASGLIKNHYPKGLRIQM